MLDALNLVATLVGYLTLGFILAATLLQKLEPILDLQMIAFDIITGRVEDFCIFKGQVKDEELDEDFDDIEVVVAEPIDVQEKTDPSEADTQPPQPEKPEEDAG